MLGPIAIKSNKQLQKLIQIVCLLCGGCITSLSYKGIFKKVNLHALGAQTNVRCTKSNFISIFTYQPCTSRFLRGMVLTQHCCNITRSHLMEKVARSGLTGPRWTAPGELRGFKQTNPNKNKNKQTNQTETKKPNPKPKPLNYFGGREG